MKITGKIPFEPAMCILTMQALSNEYLKGKELTFQDREYYYNAKRIVNEFAATTTQDWTSFNRFDAKKSNAIEEMVSYW
tara:strand:+ start:488 stop:724 length:237 start_codon:yes stop_codon:yes gene_type:complete